MARKRKRFLWVGLTLVAISVTAVVSVRAIGNKPAKIDAEKLGEGGTDRSGALRRGHR